MFVKMKTNGYCVGIDINSNAIDLAKENALLNSLNNIEFMHISLQAFKQTSFDLICCNPPYHKDKFHPDTANFDGTLTLDELAKYAYDILKDKGRCNIIIKAERLSESITVFNTFRFGLKRIKCIHHSINHPASSVCLEFIKNGSHQLIIEAPVINHKEFL